MNHDEPHLAAGWLAAAQRPEVRAALEAVFESARSAIESRGPACWASGRCCNFRKTGHLLYVTGLEAAYTVSRAGWVGNQRLAAALDSGGCPYQSGNLCGVHADKPLGCRLYFCDRTAQSWQNDLYERLQQDLRALHERHGIDYRYGEWRAMLATVGTAHQAANTLAPPSTEGPASATEPGPF